jgi:DNA gyrase inhibitor GyrI
MPLDPITQKHLNHLRIRGAPATIPGSAGFVGTYEAEETWRQTGRALVVPLTRGFHAAELKEAYAKLAAAAEAQKLHAVDEPMFALKGDPNEDPPHKWEYEAVLPIRGAGKADDGVTMARVQGGMHLVALTSRGLPDLRNLYVYLFGKFLPAKKQQLMRPYLLHQVLEGLDDAHEHDDRLTIAVYVPAVLSIKPVPVPGESGEA